MQNKKYLWLYLLFPFVGVVNISAQIPQSMRVLQEAPWILSPMNTQSMRPIPAYWDPQKKHYLIDFLAFLREIKIPVIIQNNNVHVEYADMVRDVDFSEGIVKISEIVDSLDVNGYLKNEDRFLLTPLNIKKVLPEGNIIFDIKRLQILVSDEMFVRSGFQVRTPSLKQGPLLYGRNRRLIGGSWIGYRMSRIQRPEYTASYNGTFDLRSNLLWGQINVDASVSHIDSTSTRFREASYLLDFPESAWIKQIKLGRTYEHNWIGRQMYEGLYISNEPLSTRHQQREIKVSGIAEPNAIVSALVGGVLADRVQADIHGNYVLYVPAYYGTFQAEIEIIPESGGPPRRETRSLFIADELVPTGRLYYNLQGGQTRFDKDPYGHGKISYGITSTLTILSSATYLKTDQVATLGASKQIAGNLTMSAELAYPARAIKATMRLYLKSIQLQTNAIIAEESEFAYFKQYWTGSLGWNKRYLSLFVNGSHTESFSGRTTTYAQASGTVRIGHQMNLMLAAGPRKNRYAQNVEDVRYQWRSTLTRYIRQGKIRGRIGFQADGGRFETLDFTGVTFYGTYKNVSFGSRVGYDRIADGVTTSFSLRINAPWGNFASHSSFDPDNTYHRQSLYGSMILDRQSEFSRHTYPWSSAILQPFLDMNHDGQKDPREPFMDDLDIQVMRTSTHIDKYGGIRADFLEPSTPYQVLINPRSIDDPQLSLPNGNMFSFISDPTERKYIHIPVHKKTIIVGSVANLPLSSPSLAVVIFYQEGEEVARSAISQDGKFSLLLVPGIYQIELVDLLGKEDLNLFSQTLDLRSELTYDLNIR